ncbi:hypothetical protein Aci011_087 [Acinetobacter phage vB_AbaM_B09_Aci01-1]|uniref:Uncharacterized protein n=3 Tax=Saclayvirus TaxID=2733128 RepID=A0A386KL96_9CAUD|nr:hypothetical protein HOU29_gp094 [Acinetobacter phage vB_AbaM_B09_Aci01-1]YP_009813310.1 hypothetical protein HOU30_gp102 [Acinetobacter phage vB_AbaM_B09_Aci02-2]YP_009813940.1 hypothetical protein HOU35_gp091 [Acinetobacter phage vB_AbaM_B09_Aci05]AZF88487.1 hypothetical protein TAC_0099 [Acinetobacter phage TAC1]QMP19076.1 hypothetical protein FKOIJHOC_00128 [Acinetobacter phage Ab_121]UYL86261.1 baseplate wedge protein [Acinetobacter phage vB_AbaM_CP14]AYD82453.1 hypothetical protein A
MKALFAGYWIAMFLCLLGWILNIKQIIGSAAVFSWLLVAKVAGIFIFPVGIVLGWAGVF